MARRELRANVAGDTRRFAATIGALEGISGACPRPFELLAKLEHGSASLAEIRAVLDHAADAAGEHLRSGELIEAEGIEAARLLAWEIMALMAASATRAAEIAEGEPWAPPAGQPGAPI